MRGPLSEDEIDLYHHLKTINDSRKLKAMMPAWLKRELAKPLPRFIFVPDREPMLPRMCTPFIAPKLEIPYSTSDTAEYVQLFEQLNNLKPTTGETK